MEATKEQHELLRELCNEFTTVSADFTIKNAVLASKIGFSPTGVASTAVAGSIKSLALTLVAENQVVGKQTSKDETRDFLTGICKSAIEDVLIGMESTDKFFNK